MFEKGSRESRQPKKAHRNRFLEILHEHSLTIFLLITWIGWAALYFKVDPDSKWGTVVSNLVSEWSQQIGLVLLTKRLIETGSKESSKKQLARCPVAARKRCRKESSGESPEL